MKQLIAILVAVTATLANAETIPVYLDPATDTPQIGELEAISLAVPAQWPNGSVPQQGWQPVYLHGIFEVYVDNNDVAKDLNAKPGSPYYLAPEKNNPVLAIATEKDKVDILSVDTWFCKMQVETIVVGYIPSANLSASQIASPNGSNKTASPAIAQPATAAASELVGRLEKTGLIGKNRTGQSYKITGPDGKTLAFVDTSEVPDRDHVQDFLRLDVRITGFLTQPEEGSDVIIKARSIKKAF